MLKRAILIAALLCIAAPACAADAAKQIVLNASNAIAMLNALAKLGEPYEKDGGDKPMRAYYKFDSDTLLRFAKNMASLKYVGDVTENARATAIRAIAAGKEIKPGSAELIEAEAQLRELQAKEFTLNLFPIQIDALKLKDNAIPPAVLSALLPIITE